jgi:hypothetical protein
MRRIAAIAAVLLPLAASAQTISPPPSGYQRLFANTTSSGNGADLTEDTLTNCSTYTLPAGQLANVNDTVHILASGAMGGTTDNKTARMKVGGTLLQGATGTTASGVAWQTDTWLIKRGSNQQTVSSQGLVSNTAIAIINNGAVAITDTSAQAITVTGQNTTSSVAGSITCNFLIVDFYRGS